MARVQVSIHLAENKKAPVIFIMPRSVPGAYSITNYDAFVENIYAVNTNGEKLVMRKDDTAPRWYYNDTTNPVTGIHYEVDLKQMESLLTPTEASLVRPGFAGILNYAVFGWIDGTEKERVQCTVQTFNQWPIFSTNQPAATLSKGSLTFSTDNYYSLADGQIFTGTKLRVKEYKGIVPLFIAAYCETGDEYLDDYGKQGTMSLEILNNYFGELPFKQYSILLRKALPSGPVGVSAFGMEHLQSSTFFGDTSGLRTHAMSQQGIIRTMPTYLHHMGHAFLPLRCYGDAYRPFVKEIPPIINNIWFNEGFMWFLPYEALKSEPMKKRFYTNTYQTDPQIKKMSLSELSQEASLMYANDFRLGRAVFSRGAMMAIDMDNYLKEKSNGEKSMKDILRYLYYWSKENNRPFTMDEFPELINKACGIDLRPVYNKWLLPIK